MTLCKKHNARVVKIGNTRLASLNELNRVFNSEITAQANAAQRKKEQAEKLASYKRKAVEAVVRFGPKGLLDAKPEDFDRLLKVAIGQDESFKNTFRERRLDPAEERAQIKQQIEELEALYRRINL